MNRLSRNFNLLLLAGALVMPLGAGAYAAARPQSEQQDKDAKERAEKAEKAAKAEKKLRVFDAKHNDYHDWDANEDHAYRTYLTERHEEYTDFGKLTTEKQTEYWDWRHDHPDRDNDRDSH